MIEASTAQITFDLVMEEDMCFVEGCYKLLNKDWRIFIISKKKNVHKMIVEKEVTWESGNTGIVVKLPENVRLNKINAMKILSDILDVSAWSEVIGPDSMQLR